MLCFFLINTARNAEEIIRSPGFRIVLSGLAKVGDLGWSELLVGRRRGRSLAERVSRGEPGRNLEENREAGNNEGAVPQPHLQRL